MTTRQKIEEDIVAKISENLSGDEIEVTRTPVEITEFTHPLGGIVIRTQRAQYSQASRIQHNAKIYVEVQLWYNSLLTDDKLYEYVELVRKTITGMSPIGGSPYIPVSEDPLGYEDESFIFGMLFSTEIPYLLGN